MVSRRKSGVGHFAAKQESIVIVLNNHLTFAIQKCYNDGNDDVLIDEVVRISKIIAVRVICFFGAKLDNAAVVLLRKVRLHPCYYCPQPTPIVSLRRDPHPHGLESAFRATTRCFCGSQVPGRSICQHGFRAGPMALASDCGLLHCARRSAARGSAGNITTREVHKSGSFVVDFPPTTCGISIRKHRFRIGE